MDFMKLSFGRVVKWVQICLELRRSVDVDFMRLQVLSVSIH